MIDRPLCVLECAEGRFVIVVFFDIFRNCTFGFYEAVQLGPEERITVIIAQNLFDVAMKER